MQEDRQMPCLKKTIPGSTAVTAKGDPGVLGHHHLRMNQPCAEAAPKPQCHPRLHKESARIKITRSVDATLKCLGRPHSLSYHLSLVLGQIPTFSVLLATDQPSIHFGQARPVLLSAVALATLQEWLGLCG